MPDLRSVPDDTKWRIATQYAVGMRAIYESVFRPAIQNRYDELEQEAGFRMAQFSVEIARSLKFPLDTARELAESLHAVNTLVFGPEYKDEVIGIGDDGAVIIIRICPALENDSCSCSSGNGTFHRCMAFTIASQKIMNPKYSSRFVRAMCMGDRQCEIKIEPDNEAGKKPAQKSP